MSALTLRSQLWLTLPVPTKLYTGQTIIVTGSNVGMGLEAARHFAGLDAAKVILAVRSLERGEAAKADIETSTSRLGVVEVWELDLSDYASVLAFGERVETLERLDVVIGNAGVYLWGFERARGMGKGDGDEMTVAVNVVGTMLLALLVLPKMRETREGVGKGENGTGVLSFVGSFTHEDTSFPERKAGNIFEGLNREEGARMGDRYQVSKLIQLFCARALASAVTESERCKVVISTVNPGFVKTDIMRNTSFPRNLFIFFLQKLFSRTPEEGGRTLVNAAEIGVESHGEYLDDCVVGRVSKYVESEEGREMQERVWKELGGKLEGIKPGIMSNI